MSRLSITTFAPRRPIGRILALPALVLSCSLTAVAANKTTPAAPPKFQVEEATIASIHEAILAQELTATALVKLYLARIKAYNGPGVEEPEGILGPIKPIANARGINALITLNLRPATRKVWGFDARKARSMTDPVDADPNMPDALEVAAELDEYFARTGKLIGPLHGIVFSLKDQYDTFDMRTTSGADAFYANDRPPDDATFVKRMRDAGAIILAKANMGEYASGIRSAWGGTEVNPYDTTRVPGGSSGGSGMSVAANLVTCSIGEESGPSVRAPATFNNCVGLSPTQELVSRDGMINIGLNTRVGPVTRAVEDTARILTVIAGYDPKDELTAFAVGRTPEKPYESYAQGTSLAGMRIGVVSEYMDRNVFAGPLYVNIDIVDQAIEDLRKLGATIVEPGPEGLFTPYIQRFTPALLGSTWTRLFPEHFPVDAEGKPAGDHVGTLVAMTMDPAFVPGGTTLRNFGSAPVVGGSKFGFNLYLAQRGDANIRTIDDLVNKANFFTDAHEGSKKVSMANNNKALHLDNTERLQRRFAVQQIVLACLAELQLDAVVYPTGNIPPRRIDRPRDPSDNGIGNYGMWTFLGQQGFPAMTVPAGFTTEVYDRVYEQTATVDGAGGRSSPRVVGLEGPVATRLPVGIDFLGRPFSEPVLFKIAAAYEKATKHRAPPPNFGPLPDDS